MKNLSYFLWLCVLGLAGYVVYFFATTTKWREQDLAMVERQNEALQKIIVLTQLKTIELTNFKASMVAYNGTSSRDMKMLCFADSIQILAHQTITTNQQALQKEDWQAIATNYIAYCQFLHALDTLSQDSQEIKIEGVPKYLNYELLQETYWLHNENKIIRAENKRSECFLQQIGGCCSCNNPSIRAKVMPKAYVVREGVMYSGYLVLTTLTSSIKPKMKASKGKVGVNGNEGEISIPYQPVKFDANGQSKQKIDAQITFKKSYKAMNDTIIYLSTSYTVKRKK